MTAGSSCLREVNKVEIAEDAGANPHHRLEDLEVVGEAVEDALEVVGRPGCRLQQASARRRGLARVAVPEWCRGEGHQSLPTLSFLFRHDGLPPAPPECRSHPGHAPSTDGINRRSPGWPRDPIAAQRPHSQTAMWSMRIGCWSQASRSSGHPGHH